VLVKSKHCLGADDSLDSKNRSECRLEMMSVSCGDAAPDIAAAGDLMNLKYLIEAAQTSNNSIEFAVGYLNGNEGGYVIVEGFEIEFAATGSKGPGPQEPSDSGLCCIAGNAQLVAELTDLRSRIADQFQ